MRKLRLRDHQWLSEGHVIINWPIKDWNPGFSRTHQWFTYLLTFVCLFVCFCPITLLERTRLRSKPHGKAEGWEELGWLINSASPFPLPSPQAWGKGRNQGKLCSQNLKTLWNLWNPQLLPMSPAYVFFCWMCHGWGLLQMTPFADSSLQQKRMYKMHRGDKLRT